MPSVDETQRVLDAELQLELEFPEAPRHEVRAVVARAWVGLVHARVRDFVPLLIHRAAAAELHSRGHRRQRRG
jgi:hypothetical protein